VFEINQGITVPLNYFGNMFDKISHTSFINIWGNIDWNSIIIVDG
jgi:hypothetical protein